MRIIPFIYKDVIEALQYTPSAMWLVVCIAAAIILAITHYKKKVTMGRTILYFSFVIYVFTILNYSFFSREPGSRTDVDLELFSTWGNTWQAHAYFIENIIMFLPLGVLIPLIWKKARGCWQILLLSLLCSVILESMQLVTGRGFFQVDDLMTNTLGGVCGFVIFRLIQWTLGRKI